ncbi:PAS domain S-box protein [Fulvivirga sp. RKSG066]|uniref:PAS domain-containing sensor histidine kinase n=1 Tax=Fulvivirga aurantia TaxID=2529383 RepID=UPI0012BBF8CD|nr:ATP-binding protein [Fulvivirga aurantia]MTI21153.1 PAS domain S-box protein [Fulvivirga aurantia]
MFDGKPIEGLSEMSNHTEERVAQQDLEIARLRAELEKYQSASKGANDGLWDWDFRKNEPFVSQPWKSMLGIKETDVVDMHELWKELLHPDDKEIALQAFKNFITGRTTSYYQEFRMRHTDGSYKWILSKAQAVRGEDGKAIRVSGSHTDITERKSVTDALRKSEQKYRNLFQNSLVAMFRCKVDDGKVIEANDKFLELLQVSDLDDYPVGFDMFVHEREKKHLLQMLAINGYIDNIELQVKTATGARIWVSYSAVIYPEEQIIECILKDISQTKENLLELQKVNFELDSFVYHASHDLRSPLRSILGLIDLYRLESDEKVRLECIEKIEGSVKRLDDLVMELLSISRNDRVNDPHIDVNLMVEINHSISSYYNASNTDGLEIITKVSQRIPFKSDLTRVRIILNNLISNAIKYRSFHKERTFISIEATVTKKELVLKVEDNGEGIEESKLPHIFDMFYRATEKSEGSGLGLYIVKKVADKLDAEITVDSVELEGTTFTVTIPNTHK